MRVKRHRNTPNRLRLKAKKEATNWKASLLIDGAILFDDEKYFCFGNDNTPGSAHYYTNDKSKFPGEFRFIRKEKYPVKACPCPIFAHLSHWVLKQKSIPTFACNHDFYHILLTQHSDHCHLFWFDFAGTHYSKETIAWMNENLYFTEKAPTLQLVPQARPNEKLWDCLAQKVY